ncbi:hypothetical protein MTO96_012926 [Rhipicephalus appendiculatus]
MSMSPSNGSPLGMMSKKGRMDDYPGYENGHLAAEQADKPHHGGGGGALLPNGFSPQQAAAAAAAAHLNATLPFLALGSHPHPGGLLSAAMGIPLPGATPHHPLGGAAPSRTDHHLAKAAPPQLDPQAALRLRDDGGSVRDRNFSSYDGSRLKDSAAFVNELSGAEGSSSPRAPRRGRGAVEAREGLAWTSATPSTRHLVSALCLRSRRSCATYRACSRLAADNARHQDRQISIEKAELKMEVLRERGLRESLEKQLSEEQRTRVLYQKRLKKERRCRRRIQDQLELEQKKRSQYEEVLRNSAAADHRSPPAQSQPQPQPTHAQATQQLTPPERVPSPDMDPERHSRQESEKKAESTTSVG